ncbi:unnamed protein product [marine sediment metagenome]|uniref:HTH lysR-type domain-containing protein n=1 Tax=marine sediment metagenome TaxID=412755 RepID=X1HRU2_9ZZZZ
MKLKEGTPKIKIWIETETGSIFGPGVYSILKSIIDNGSISATCRKLEISYTKAWSKIKVTEERLGVTIIKRKRGGTNGGGSIITQEGKELMDTYEKYASEVQSKSLCIFKKYFD